MLNEATQVRRAIEHASAGTIDRRWLVELVALGAIAREHVLLIGPPGTGKSHVVRRIASTLGARSFEYLLGRFTEPSELFGPVDLVRLREGEMVTRTEGMLPEAEFAFLDEVFLGSTAILNTLLGLLNERVFRRGPQRRSVPLRICVGASNALPDDPALAAFADRFLLRAHVDPLPDGKLENLLEATARPSGPLEAVASLSDLDVLAEAARQVDLTAVRPLVAQAIRRLRGVGIELSDRRAVQSQRLIGAAAVLAGRDAATPADLWPLVFVVPDRVGQVAGREALRDLLADSHNPCLSAAAAVASNGPEARAELLVDRGAALLADPVQDDAWRGRLEGVARDIDAGFTTSTLPTALAEIRGRIVERLQRP